MGELLSIFVLGTILWFGAILLLTGLFTVYFGAGKSRMIGLAILLVGLVCVVGTILTQVPVGNELLSIPFFTDVDIGLHVLGMLGAMLGGLIGLVAFLASLMKA